MQADPKMLERFIYWVNEREYVRKNKEDGVAQPWTKDPILQQYHFCNIRREDDRGTKELRAVCKDLSVKFTELPEFYTAARLLNYAPSLTIYWRDGINALKDYRDESNKIFHVAYVVTTCGQRMDKLDYVDGVVGGVCETPIYRQSCLETFDCLRTVDGLGSFLAGQVVADLKNDRYLADAPDWWSFAVMGPGSKKGLDFLYGPGTTERNFRERLKMLEVETMGKIPTLHAQDLQNCLCEFSKYVRYLDNLRGRRRMYHVHERMQGR